ncbi:polymorphic toxin type 44 domain-containing protein [Chondromyces crocatus]|uniref:Bacterial toxin 44 domain-containing protein n=1 Tax=Chondromyces crocatus TaxID=52 RepID=A0A0K1E9I8_CHOCO|nr:polymorphic toxin type 44 domain-containing protein [Chondromyces crocatus]AKT37535.1 uncharacterized protein CMC5_016760 [Chondromyces crocatus]
MSQNDSSETPPTGTDPVRQEATQATFGDNAPGECTNGCPEYVLVLKGRPPDSDPFKKHPLPSSRRIDIEYHVAFTAADPGDPVPKQGSHAYEPSREHERPLSADEYARLQKVYVWAEPYGYAALRIREANELAKGRIAVPREKLRHEQVGSKTRLICEFDVLDSVPGYIASEMQKNLNDPDVGRIRNHLNTARQQVQGDTFGRLDGFAAAGETAQGLGIFGNRVRADEGWINSGMDLIAGDVNDWDHKPRIRPVWGTDNRIGNKPVVYYYDVWSNLHYGYIANAATIPKHTAQGGSSFANIFDSGRLDENADSSAVSAGHDLYGTNPAANIDDVIALVERNQGLWARSAR